MLEIRDVGGRSGRNFEDGVEVSEWRLEDFVGDFILLQPKGEGIRKLEMSEDIGREANEATKVSLILAGIVEKVVREGLRTKRDFAGEEVVGARSVLL